MQYAVYAVLSVCCTWCMLYSVDAVVSVCCTRCMLYLVSTFDHGMERYRGITKLRVLRWRLSSGRDRERRDEMGQIFMTNWDLENFMCESIYHPQYCQVWVPIQCVITLIRGLPNPLSEILPLVSHIRSYLPHCSHLHPPSLSFSSTTLPSSQNTKFSDPSLSPHGMIMSWHRVQHTPSTTYTEYSIHSVQYTPSKACTEYSIHRVQHTPSTAYPEYSIHPVQHTPSTVYTEYSIPRVQHTLSTAYIKYSIHRVQHTPCTASTQDCLFPFILMIMSWPLNVASASSVPPYTIDCHQSARHVSSKVKSPCHIPTFASQLTDE